MHKRTLGPHGPEVSAIGLGCMGMSAFYGATDEAEALRTIHRALELGCNFLDTSDMYGPHTNEELVGRAIAGRRDEVFLATKFGIKLEPGDPPRRSIDGSPEYVRVGLRGSLRRLGVDHIDLYYQHRVDPNTPIEETVGAMAELVAAGQGPPPRPLRGERARRSAARTPCTRSRPCRASTRCGRATSRTESLPDAEGARDRARRLLAARTRLPVGALHLARGARRGRLPPLRAALHRREPQAEPEARRARQGARGREGDHARAAGARVGARTAASTSSRSPAPSGSPTWRRTSPPRRSS